MLLALVYVLFSILENIFNDFSNRFFLLATLTVGGFIVKEKGFLDLGIQKLTPLINKLKQQ